METSSNLNKNPSIKKDAASQSRHKIIISFFADKRRIKTGRLFYQIRIEIKLKMEINIYRLNHVFQGIVQAVKIVFIGEDIIVELDNQVAGGA